MQFTNKPTTPSPDPAVTDTNAAFAMGALFADMNHDIRTSMNGIVGMLELLLDTKLTKSQRQYATFAQNGADVLLETIERIVDLSLMESNQFKLAQTSFDLPQELQAACANKHAAAQDKELRLIVNPPPSVLLNGDPARVRQVIAGLVGNVIRVAESGDITVDAEMSAGPDNQSHLRVTVHATVLSETGAQLASMLTQPEKSGIAMLRQHGKSAAEMALCIQLAKLMGGRIGIDNTSGQGTTFWFSVLTQALGASSSSPAAPSVDVTQLLKGRRVLVVDDNPVNQHVAARMVEKFGCKAEVAGNGREAVDMHAASRYDLVLMDCEMPGLDGYQATQRIRDMEGVSRRTPVIALTACTTLDEREKCMTAGMDDFLSKPIRPQILKDMIARWLSPVAYAGAEPIAVSHGDELEAVQEMFGTDFTELASLYLTDSPPRLAALRGAWADGDNILLVKIAHAFSGSNASIGATGLSMLCKELEANVKASALDDVEKRLAAIEAEYYRISSKLQAMIAISA